MNNSAQYSAITAAPPVGPGLAPGRGATQGRALQIGAAASDLPITAFEFSRWSDAGWTATGELTSPEFPIERPCIHFLIGGGAWEGKICVELVVNGKNLRSSTGPNTGNPGETDRLDCQTWDGSDFAGRKAVIKIKDTATGGWGHINVDGIVQSASAVPGS